MCVCVCVFIKGDWKIMTFYLRGYINKYKLDSSKNH